MADIELPGMGGNHKSKQDKTKVIMVIVGIVGVALTYLMYRHSSTSTNSGYAGQTATPTGTGGEASPDQSTAFSGALTALGGQLSDAQSQLASQTGTISKLQSSLTTATKNISGLESYNTSLKSGLKNMEAANSKRDTEIKSLTREVADARTKAANALKATRAPKKQHVTHPAAHSTSQHVYTVESGDNLSEIASHYHESWQKLYSENRKAVGSNPNLIHPGLKLKVP